MPEMGEIKRICKGSSHKFIWQACEGCGKERWVQIVRGKPCNTRCRSCANKLRPHPFGDKSPHWKGGRFHNAEGYIQVRLYPNDFFYPMVDKKGYVLEHRLVIAKALKRCLLSWEVVHHKEGYAKDENRYPETLQLLPSKHQHLVDTSIKSLISRLKKQVDEQGKRITLLEAENVLLRQQIPLEYSQQCEGGNNG